MLATDPKSLTGTRTSTVPRDRAVGRPEGCWIAIALLIGVATGCNDGLGRVQGEVRLAGERVFGDEQTIADITFSPAGGSGSVATGSVDTSGAYRLAVGANDGIRPGKYNVGVLVRRIDAPDGKTGYPDVTILSARKHANPATSGIVADVTAGSNTIDIEVDRAGAAVK